MKTFLKILLALVIVAALCGVVYVCLPETGKVYVKGYIQQKTDDEAKEKIDSLKKNTITYTETQTNGIQKKTDSGVTYGDALTKKSKSSVWYYEETGDGGFDITFYGTKVTMDLTNYGADGSYINMTLKVVFSFPAGGKSSVTMYIGDTQLDDNTKSAALQALVN
jgi:uncharacterized protein YxeA